MLTCKEATHLMSEGADRKLGFGERIVLRLHLAICEGCRNARAQLILLRSAVKRLSRDGDEKETA